MVPGALRPFAPSRTREGLGGLVVTRSPNEERALAPVVGFEPDPRPLPETARPGGAAHDPIARAVSRRIDAFLEAEDRPELRASWHHAVNFTQHELRRLESVDLSAHAFVLLSRQTHPLLRALILRVEQQDVPVVYVPHSPLTRFQVDLPVSRAALRGAAERDWIAAHADADPSRIDVVGNPATSISDAPAPVLTGRGVLAVSPDPEPELRRMIGLLVDAGLDDVVLAPHPRSDEAMLRRILPGGWTLHRGGHTVELLREGPRWLIQRSSGVAWESAQLGIPTADVRLDDEIPAYPLLEDERAFPALRTPDDVRAFTAGAASADRAALRTVAEQWCATDGEAAADRIRAVLDGAAPAVRIVDAWAPGGVLHRQSPVGRI